MASSDPAAVLAIHGLVKDYHGLRPLRLAHLEVRPRERVALSGFDATSAEVLINLVNGAILPDQGEVRVFGSPTSAIANEAEWFATLDRFGIVTPRAVLLDASTVAQNLALPFTIEIDRLGDEIRATIAGLAGEVDLPGEGLDVAVERVPPETRLRIHLAKALATGPEVLLLEHPTAPLPREHVAPFAALVSRVAERRGLTVLAITEDALFADQVATAHYRLQGGTGALISARGWRRFF